LVVPKVMRKVVMWDALMAVVRVDQMVLRGY